MSAIVWRAEGSCRLSNREAGSGVVVELTLPLARAQTPTQTSGVGGMQ
jgi:hypothetical protein